MYKNRKGLLTASLIATVLLLTGCSDYDNGYKASEIKFRSEFVQKFGNIDSEQDWNYADRAQVTVVTASPRNITIYTEKNGTYTQVANFLNVSGTQVLKFDVQKDTYNIVVNDGTTAYRCMMGGTVDFEAGITSTGELTEETRSHNVNRNEWPSQFIIPANITEEEERRVVEEFSKVHYGAYNEVILPWDKIFVQQVHKGEINYIDQTGNAATLGSDYMNHLQIYNKNSSVTQTVYGNSADQVGNYEHVNDFNSGDQHADYGEIIGDTYMFDLDPTDVVTETIKGVDGQTIHWVKQWLYHNSKDSKYHAEYIYKVVDGNLYLGFDFYATLPDGQTANKNMRVERDWVFNDWIIKVTAGQGAIVPQAALQNARAASYILAGEDLGGGFDIDYNDVVVKVEHLAGQQLANIVPLAAGGTLASYLFFTDADGKEVCAGEIHQLLGASPAASGKYVPINLDDANTMVGETVPVKVGADWSLANYSTDSWDAEGQTNGNMGGFTIRVLPAGTPAMSKTLAWDHSAFSSSEASVVQAPNAGDAPFILCIPYSYTRTDTPTKGKKTIYTWLWPQECVGITEVYSKFSDWVDDHTAGKDWYTEPDRSLTVNVSGSNGNVVDEEEDMTEEEVAATNPNSGATANSMAISIPTYAVEPVPAPALQLKNGGTTIDVELGQVFDIYDYIDTNFPVWCESHSPGEIDYYNGSETMLIPKIDRKETKVTVTQYGFGGKSMDITVRTGMDDTRPESGAWISAYNLDTAIGGTQTITVNLGNSDGAITAWSSDPSIASVTVSGNTVTVTGLKMGGAYIFTRIAGTDTYRPALGITYVNVNPPVGAILYTTEVIRTSGVSTSALQMGNSTVNIKSGDYLMIHSKNKSGYDSRRDGLTATYNGQTYSIGQNKNWEWAAIGFYVTGTGTQTVTLHAPATSEYAEQTVTITLNVN